MEAISVRKTIQEIAADHAIHPIQVSQWKRQLLDSASELFSRGKKSMHSSESQTKEADELFQQICKLQMELEWLKKISAALTPMNCASWSIMLTLSSASAGIALCSAYRDRRSTTGQLLCVNRHCGSWPGSMPSTSSIPAAAAGGWSRTWPEKGSRSAATASEITCGPWVCGRSIRKPALRFPATHPSRFPAWWISGRSRWWIRCGLLTSPTYHCRNDSCTKWQLWISISDKCSAGSYPTALTRSSAWRLWRWPSAVAGGHRSSTPTKGASSYLFSVGSRRDLIPKCFTRVLMRTFSAREILSRY